MLARIEAQNMEQKHAEIRLQTQLSRLQLLDRITRAKAERQDLRSIFQVVIGTLEEDMPLDFACVCLYDEVAGILTVANVRTHTAPLAAKLRLIEQALIPIYNNGL